MFDVGRQRGRRRGTFVLGHLHAGRLPRERVSRSSREPYVASKRLAEPGDQFGGPLTYDRTVPDSPAAQPGRVAEGLCGGPAAFRVC